MLSSLSSTSDWLKLGSLLLADLRLASFLLALAPLDYWVWAGFVLRDYLPFFSAEFALFAGSVA